MRWTRFHWTTTIRTNVPDRAQAGPRLPRSGRLDRRNTRPWTRLVQGPSCALRPVPDRAHIAARFAVSSVPDSQTMAVQAGTRVLVVDHSGAVQPELPTVPDIHGKPANRRKQPSRTLATVRESAHTNGGMSCPVPTSPRTRRPSAPRCCAWSRTPIDLDLSTTGDTYPSVTTIRFTAREAAAESFVDLIAPAVREVVLNGRALDPAAVYADGRIALTNLAADNELRVVADCAYMNTGEGLHRSVDPADGRTYLYTNFEMPDARRVFASFEQPDLKASFAFTVTAPADWLVLSNSPTPSPGQPSAAGVARWRFAPTPRISTYLTAIAAGPYHMVRDRYVGKSGQVVPLGVACRASLAAHLDAGRDLRGHQAGLRLLHRGVRPAVPVREVRPDLRTRVQPRRDGERRAGHVHRGRTCSGPR